MRGKFWAFIRASPGHTDYVPQTCHARKVRDAHGSGLEDNILTNDPGPMRRGKSWRAMHQLRGLLN
jgi:hypothetical protein